MPTRIPDQDSVVIGEGSHLIIKHIVIHCRAMQESQQRPISTPAQPIMDDTTRTLQRMLYQGVIVYVYV
jgi:hypothetical protein